MAEREDDREVGPALRKQRGFEAVAEETREPERASRIRVAEDARTDERQEHAAARLSEAASTLQQNADALRETREAIERQERALAESREAAREVAERTRALRDRVEENRRALRDEPPRDES